MSFSRRRSHVSKEPDEIEIQDETRLAELGYKQELRRDWSLLHNFGVSFSIIVSPMLWDIRNLFKYYGDLHYNTLAS